MNDRSPRFWGDSRRDWLTNAALFVGIVACWLLITALGGIPSLPLL